VYCTRFALPVITSLLAWVYLLSKGFVFRGQAHSAELNSLDKVRGDPGMVFQSLNLFPHMTVMEN
jgi:ABC-type polar amino acid transport system ATPase subunit